MNNFAIFVIGPAGVGKSTFCKSLQEYYSTLKRNISLFNLDPASQHGDYHFSIQEKWDLHSIMDKYNLGPNGAMMKSLQLCSNDVNWINDHIAGFNNESILVDCPGQIELYVHDDSIQNIMNIFKQNHYSIISLYLIDSTFIIDDVKFKCSMLNALSAMFMFSTPHINILTKMDLVPHIDQDRDTFIDTLFPDSDDYADADADEEKKTTPFIRNIDRLLESSLSNTVIPFNRHNQDDYWVISNYIDRMTNYDADEFIK
jgi:GTPase SAR1 family protein